MHRWRITGNAMSCSITIGLELAGVAPTMAWPGARTCRPEPFEELSMDPVPHVAVEAALRDSLRAGLAGDVGAYRQFLQQLSGYLRGYLRRRLPSAPADVEDVLQETLLAIHNGRHTWDPVQPLTPWLYAIARYKLIDFARSRARHAARMQPLDGFEDLLATSDEDPSQAGHDVAILLEQLPDRHRLPLLYVKVEGLSVREAAVRAGMSESAIKVGVHRGLKALAGMMRAKP
jgi:RNA polymerase sigma-70 factor, ECF subfamily